MHGLYNLPSSNLKLIEYSDSDQGGDLDNQKSTFGRIYAFCAWEMPYSLGLQIKKQTII